MACVQSLVCLRVCYRDKQVGGDNEEITHMDSHFVTVHIFYTSVVCTGSQLGFSSLMSRVLGWIWSGSATERGASGGWD